MGIPKQKGGSKMVEKKMTKREMFQTVLVVLTACGADETLVAGIEHEIDLLDRKRADKAPNAKKVAEQNVVKNAIVDVLADSGPARATDIANAVGVAVQKATALLKQMKDAGEVVREQDKKVVTFRLP